MNQKKPPAAVETTTSAQDGQILPQPKPAGKLKFSRRQQRAIDALRPGAWVPREALDRAAGVSNSPDMVQHLKAKLGDDSILMERYEAIDRDGQPCRPGRYRMTDVGRERLRQLEGRAAA